MNQSPVSPTFQSASRGRRLENRRYGLAVHDTDARFGDRGDCPRTTTRSAEAQSFVHRTSWFSAFLDFDL